MKTEIELGVKTTIKIDIEELAKTLISDTDNLVELFYQLSLSADIKGPNNNNIKFLAEKMSAFPTQEQTFKFISELNSRMIYEKLKHNLG